MDEESEFSFFKLRKQGKIYISRLFDFVAGQQERMRQVRMIFDGCDKQVLGEIEGALCLRVTGNVRKTQVTALVSQDDRRVRRLSLQSFQTRAGDWVQSYDKHEFTFKAAEFERLLNFLSQIEFVDLSNKDRFQIQDISLNHGPKAIIDAADHGIVEHVKHMDAQARRAILNGLQPSLTSAEINIVLGRNRASKSSKLRCYPRPGTSSIGKTSSTENNGYLDTASTTESCANSTAKWSSQQGVPTIGIGRLWTFS